MHNSTENIPHAHASHEHGGPKVYTRNLVALLIHKYARTVELPTSLPTEDTDDE